MKASIYTLGCKVNQYESEYMAEMLKKAGFEIVSPDQEADYYIINSCTVTATADQKTRQNVRKFKRLHPESTIILTGCMPQAFPQNAQELDQADIILTNKNNKDILSLINEYNISKKRIVAIDKHKKGDAFTKCNISGFGERIRAFVKIEDGCDRFCSYCIIPMSRGRVRSKDIDDLKKEIHNLAQNSVKEIVLVGINLSSYGKNEDFNIVDAVRICNDEPEIKRVRLGSLEPDHITDDIIDGLAKFEKFCPQFHISLQSGCDKTLKNMNRHYNSAEYEDLCNKLRNTFKNATITTDVMVGFHDETIEDFYESLSFVKKIKFNKVHIFPYSNREGTVASRRGDNVSKKEKERRALLMSEECNKIRYEYFESLIGKEDFVLFEEKIDDKTYQGYTMGYTPVQTKSDADLTGKELKVRISGFDINKDCCFASLS